MISYNDFVFAKVNERDARREIRDSYLSRGVKEGKKIYVAMNYRQKLLRKIVETGNNRSVLGEARRVGEDTEDTRREFH